MAALLRMIARRPVTSFMVIGLGAGFLTASIRPIADAEILPFDMPLHGLLGGVLGVGLGAFLVTAALKGRDGVVDLARRSVRWRVPVRWYLVALFTVPVGATLLSLVIYGPPALASPAGGWPRALGEVAAVFLLQLVLFQLAEEIGFTGFLQHIGGTGITPWNSPCTSRSCGRCGISPTTLPRKAGELRH
jgi:membrane protease YdiL (CAAX protease family)